MEILFPTREWFLFDWLFLGFFLLLFAGAVSEAIVIWWGKLHPSSIAKLNRWLKSKGFGN